LSSDFAKALASEGTLPFDDAFFAGYVDAEGGIRKRNLTEIGPILASHINQLLEESSSQGFVVR
jgi:hypothetical protein